MTMLLGYFSLFVYGMCLRQKNRLATFAVD